MDIENKLPAIHDTTLHTLYAVIDAVKRDALDEAIRHTTDTVVSIQNELEYCFNTDFVAVEMLNFFTQLSATLQTCRHLDTPERLNTTKELHRILTELHTQQAAAVTTSARWANPERPDNLEIQYRIRSAKRR